MASQSTPTKSENPKNVGPEHRKALFSPGDRIANRYTVTEFVAEGSMGSVYKAEDSELDVTVALKVIRSDAAQNPKNITRFKREIQLARKVTHPNVCRIFDIGVHDHPAEPKKGWFGDSITFLTMEFLDGESLHDYLLREGPLNSDEALPLIQQIGQALSAAHEAGIVHGDFKPGNVMLINGDKTHRAVVTDFGLSRSIGLDTADSAQNSDSGDFVGTPEFMAPEQIAQGNVSKETDIYAFGLVVYLILTGALPFSGDTPIQIALERLTKQPIPPRAVQRNINRSWSNAITRCLATDPKLRFANMASVLSAFEPPRHLWLRWAWIPVVIFIGAWIWSWYFLKPQSSLAAVPEQIEVRRELRMAVLQFTNRTHNPKFDVYADWVRQVVFEILLQTKESDPISLERISRLSKEMGIPGYNLIQPESAEIVGQNLDADFLISGALDINESEPPSSLVLVLECVNLRENSQRQIKVHSHQNVETLAHQAVSTICELAGLTLPELDLNALGMHAPDQSDAWNLFVSGREKLWNLQFEEAKKSLERSASLTPNNPLPKFWLAIVLASQGQREAAMETAKHALLLCRDATTERQGVLERQFLSLMSEYRRHVESYGMVFESFSMNEKPGERDWVYFPVETTGILETIKEIESLVPKKQIVSAAEKEATKSTTPTEVHTQNDAKASPPSPDTLLNHAFLDEAQAWQQLGRDDHALVLFQESLDQFHKAKDLRGEARTNHNIGSILFNRGDFAGAETHVRQAIDLWNDIEDPAGLERSEVLLAEILRRRSDFISASKLAQQIIGRAGGESDSASIAWARITLAEIQRHEGKTDTALSQLTSALRTLRQLEDVEGQANSLLCMARIHVETQKWQAAVKSSRDASQLFDQLKSPSGQAEALRFQVQALVELGQWRVAEGPSRKLTALCQQLGTPTLQAQAHMFLGRVLYHRGKSSEARRFLERSVSGFRESGDDLRMVQSKEYLGTLYQDLGIYELASQTLLDVWRYWHNKPDQEKAKTIAARLGQIFFQEGGLHRNLHDCSRAIESFRQSLAFSERANDLRQKAITHNLLADCLQRQEHWDEAGQELENAMSIWQHIGDEKETARQWLRLADFNLDGGDLRVAESQLELALASYQKFGMVRTELDVLERLVLVLRQSGNPKKARLYARQKRELQRSLDSDQ